MTDAFRSMLDELMGKERDVPLGKRQNKALEFGDPSVCKYELVALCPNRLFRNTKSDLGRLALTQQSAPRIVVRQQPCHSTASVMPA